jgi:hypothetical protein
MAVHKQLSRRTNAKSFREFTQLLKPEDASLKMFLAHLAREPLPDVTSWTEVRSYLSHSDADHEAFVGGRMAWREFNSTTKGDRAS